MMINLHKHRIFLLPLLVLLLALSGCQAVNGLDVGQALLSDNRGKSVESRMEMSLQAVPGTSATEEDKEVIQLINSFSLKVDHLKLQENGESSAAGIVGFKGVSLPFQLYVNETGLVFNVKGAKQPFYYGLEEAGADYGIKGLDPLKTEAMSRLISEFVIRNLPNPQKISAVPVTEAVYGQQMLLTKLHAEVTGDEIPGLLKSFLQSVSKDSEGFTRLLAGLYDYLMPVIIENGGEEALKEMGLGALPLKDKEGLVTVAHDAAKLAVDTLLLMYDKGVEELYTSTPELKVILGKDTKLQADLFVDSSLNVRKHRIDLGIALPEDEEFPVQRIALHFEGENWNLGGKVSADKLSVSGALDLTGDSMTPGRMLRSFEPSSDVYRLLKEDMGITKKTLYIDYEDDYYGPYIMDGVTMVPIRYFAEELDAGVEAKGGRIVITDDLDGRKLELKIGSNQAVINGKPVTMQKPVFVDESGIGYAPLRVLAEALQARITIDEYGWIIERN